MDDRENLLFDIGRWISYWAGHYDGWTAAVEWAQRYLQTGENFIEATQAGLLIALKRGHIPLEELDTMIPCENRAEELARWFARGGKIS